MNKITNLLEMNVLLQIIDNKKYMKENDLPIINNWLKILVTDGVVEKSRMIKSGLDEKTYFRIFTLLKSHGSIRTWGFGDMDSSRGERTNDTEQHFRCGYYNSLYEQQIKQDMIEKGNIYNAKMARLRYYLFWPTTIFALLGGVYAIYQFLIAIF
ncbi:MAG: hypothetical protein LBS23_02340 [Holosporaceae bacterium]|jgi:hypothetical protein|nr:hypothetical protein [Holosporaceae bacterium]